MDLVRCCCILFLSYSRVSRSRQPPTVLMVWCSRFSDLEFSHRCLTTISSLKQQQPSLGMCHPTCRKMVFPTTQRRRDTGSEGEGEIEGDGWSAEIDVGEQQQAEQSALHQMSCNELWLPNLCYTAPDDWRERDMNCPVFACSINACYRSCGSTWWIYGLDYLEHFAWLP